MSKEQEISRKQDKGIFPDAKVYTVYDMSFGMRIITIIIGFIAGALLGFVFYSSAVVAVIAGIIAAPASVKLRQKQCINKQLKTIKSQFKALLESLATSISSGKNVFDSFKASYDDLKNQYSPSAYIVIEVQNILSGINNNITVEELLYDFAKRSGVEDIMIFADVFKTSYRKGGNIKEVIMSTYQIMNDKLEIDLEIETMMTSAKTEQNMILVMPVIFLLILNTMGGGISGQGTATSIVSTTIALILFIIAYIIGKKIMSIKI